MTFATGFICQEDGGHGGGPGGPGGSGSANNLVPANPCQYAGRALDPSAYASQGSSDNGHPMTILLNSVTGFPRGHFFDAQPLTGAPAVQAAAYGNYVFGVYMAAARSSAFQGVIRWERVCFPISRQVQYY